MKKISILLAFLFLASCKVQEIKSTNNVVICSQKYKNYFYDLTYCKATKNGVSPLLAVCMLRLESGNLQSDVFVHCKNGFGIMVGTLPKVYDSFDDCLNEYIEIVKSMLGAHSNSSDLALQLDILEKNNYFTSDKYKQIILQIAAEMQ